MSDLISKAEALEIIKHNEAQCDGISWAYREVKALPTADAVEVVHGEWERIPYSYTGGYRCSCCGCKSTEKHWKFCPHCGAKMDGKKVE